MTDMSLPTATVDGKARAHAIADALAAMQVRTTSLIAFRSEGRLLIMGPGAAATAAARRLQGALEPVLLLASDDRQAEDDPHVVHAAVEELNGHFGHFKVIVRRDDQRFDLAAVMFNTDHFDLVLDLNPTPVLPHEVPPLGYYATFGDAAHLDAALAELPQMVGEFEKPKFFNYDPAICVHGRMGKSGCSRCIDACPTLAIRSLGEQVEVDPNLCQGGGTCVSACPSGAMTYAYPNVTDLLGALRNALHVYRERGGHDPRVLFYSGEHFAECVHQAAPKLPENVFPVALEEIGTLGMDGWLSVLAYGASQVLLFLPRLAPPSVRRTLTEQVGFAHAILCGMGHGSERLGIIEGIDSATLITSLRTQPSLAPLPASTHHLSDDKRLTIRDATDHLRALAATVSTVAALPNGAPFGQVLVDQQRCTLCHACVAICPVKALNTGTGQPQLLFTEANCVQCGLCTDACPESAIRLEPRYLYPRNDAIAARLLHEEEPFNCVRCGKPFATRSMMDAIHTKLAGHWMFQEETALRRLQMCDDCRVIDMFEHGDDFQRHHRSE